MPSNWKYNGYVFKVGYDPMMETFSTSYDDCVGLVKRVITPKLGETHEEYCSRISIIGKILDVHVEINRNA